MKTPEDEAFEDIERRQGGGFPAKRQMAADKLQEPWNEDEWRRNNWRCGHGWLRGEQCEICNAPQPAQEHLHIVQSNGKHSPLLTHMMNKRTALAQPAQEPVSFPCCGHTDVIKWNQFNGVVQCHMCGQIYTASNAKQCFTTPPKREWIGLTDEEREGIAQDYSLTGLGYQSPFKSIEAKLKEKNT
jgi:hypothetical protein